MRSSPNFHDGIIRDKKTLHSFSISSRSIGATIICVLCIDFLVLELLNEATAFFFYNDFLYRKKVGYVI